MDNATIAPRVTTALVDAGLLDPERTDEARTVVATALAAPGGGTGRLGRRVAEIAGYVGGAFVVGAVIVFFAGNWAALSRGGRVAVLLVAAAVLGGAAAALVVGAGGVRAMRPPQEPARRRLGAVLVAGAAMSVGFAVGLALTPNPSSDSSWPVVAGSAAALVVALAGYLVMSTVVSQLAIAAGSTVLLASIVWVFTDRVVTPIGLLYLALGLVWLWLAEARLWREPEAGRLLGCILAVLGAQLPIADGPQGYVITGLVGVAAFGAYAIHPKWPYLAAGVVGLTLAVPEGLTDLFSGSMGAAGALLAAGVTLLLASLLGLKLRKEVAEAR